MFKRYWRQGLVLLAACGAMAISSPAAQAYCAVQPIGPGGAAAATTCGGTPAVYATSQPNYQGFAKLANPSQGISTTFAPVSMQVNAFYWYNQQWNQYELQSGAQVYVERYSGSWDWAYSYALHYWFVVPQSHIVIHDATSCLQRAGYACPL